MGDGLETGAWAMTCRWSLLGNYDVLVKHTVTALIADDAILERAIKIGLCLPFLTVSHNSNASTKED